MSDRRHADVLSFADAVGRGADLLGGKGAGLAAMQGRGLNVPPGFIITTNVCRHFRRTGELPAHVREAVRDAVIAMEQQRGRRLGDPQAPLLLAVRSGAPVSMPGMMDTVLNLGVNDSTVESLASESGADFAYDCYIRFLESFATVVLGVAPERFKAVTHSDRRRQADALRAVLDEEHGKLPTDPHEQLESAIEAVLKSWDNPRAAAYRRIENIDDSLGTAVVVQSMVFGNLNSRSGTGVVFTGNPNTGERDLYGDFLFEAQGEDVVSGSRHTLPVSAVADRLPQVWDEMKLRLAELEAWKTDVLDVEFTIEDGCLYFLQVRTAKRAPLAAVRFAQSLASEGTITRAEALMRVTPAQLEALIHSRHRAGGATDELAKGLAASPGMATGSICLTTEAVLDRAEQDEPAILVRQETSPEDIQGMAMATGILTASGGLVSHAAVVARGLSVPAVVGAETIRIDATARTVAFGATVLQEGDVITIDGDSGLVNRGAVATNGTSSNEFAELLAWADEIILAAGATTATSSAPERLAAAQHILGRPDQWAEAGAKSVGA